MIKILLKEEIKEIIETKLVEQDNQGFYDIGMMTETGLEQAVKEILMLLHERGIEEQDEHKNKEI